MKKKCVKLYLSRYILHDIQLNSYIVLLCVTVVNRMIAIIFTMTSIIIIVIINKIISMILSFFQERSAERVSNYELYAGDWRCCQNKGEHVSYFFILLMSVSQYNKYCCQNKGEHVVCFDLAWIYVIVLIYNTKNVFVL